VSRVVLLGGTGFMGRRIRRLLPRELPAVVAGRTDPGGCEFALFDIREPEAHYRVLEAGDVLINAVGPYTYDPAPLVRACLDRGAHYVDLAETPEFMARVREVARSAQRRLATITGCSSVPGLIEVYARQYPAAARIRAQLSIGTNNESSSTLLYSMLLPVGRDGWFNRTWWRGHEGLPARRYGRYPGGIEEGINLGACTVPGEFGFGFDRPLYTQALWVLAPLIGATPRSLLALGAKLGNALAPLARPLGTRIGILSLDALDEAGSIVSSVEIRATSNGLDVPAWPSVWAAELLCGTDTPPNCTSLSQLITPEAATSRLQEAGYDVRNTL
jgi:hypothetical protein